MKKYIYIVIFLISIFLPTYAYCQGLGNGSSAGGPLTSPKIITSILDTNDNILLGFTATAGAVNYLQYTNGAAGSSPSWTATGGDTDIGELHITKALGNFTIRPGTDQVDTLTLQTAAGGNAWQFGTHPAAPTFANIWPGNITANTVNYILSGNGTDSTILNGPSSTSNIFFRLGGSGLNQMTLSPGKVVLGTTSATPISQLIQGPDAVGTDKNGGILTFSTGNLTGAGAGTLAYLGFATTPAGGSGSTPRTAVLRWQITGDGNFIAATDNVPDIGASGATRPKNYYGAGFVDAVGGFKVNATAGVTKNCTILPTQMVITGGIVTSVTGGTCS